MLQGVYQTRKSLNSDGGASETDSGDQFPGKKQGGGGGKRGKDRGKELYVLIGTPSQEREKQA